MKNSTIIIIAIIAVAIVGIAAYATMNMSTTAQTTNTITQNGSKITIINNNKDVWAHWDLVIENATLKNGTIETIYIKTFIKPGENVTIDMSNALGYGEERLPTDTKIIILAWGGVYNNTATGTSKFTTTFLGWTTNQTIPSPSSYYIGYVNALPVDPVLPIGQLPSGITGNSVVITNNIPEAIAVDENDAFDQLFIQLNILVDPNGIPHFNPSVIPELCTTIAGIPTQPI